MSQEFLKVVFVANEAGTSDNWPVMLDQIESQSIQITQVKEESVTSGRVVARRFDVALIQNVTPLGAFTQFRTQMPQLPIIILADEPDDELALHALQAGAQDYLVYGQTSAAKVYQAICFAVARKRTEIPLHESEMRYKALFKNARDAAYISAGNGDFVDVNRAALHLFGYNRSEMVNANINIRDLFATPADYQQLELEFARTGAVKDYEVKFKTRDGVAMDCQLSLSARHGSDGAILEYHGIVRNITVRKSLEEMWRRYEFIVNNSREFMTLMNRNYMYEAVNESYCQAHGKKREDIVGRSVAQVWGEKTYLNVIKPTADQCFAGEEAHFKGWLWFKALGDRYMNVTYYPYHDASGEVTHLVVVSRDETERELAEEAFNRAHRQNEQLLVSIPSILIGVDGQDNVAHFNRPAEETFGLTEAEVVGKPLLECGIEWDWFEALQRIMAGRKGMQTTALNDVKYTRPDGKDCFLNMIVTPVAGATAADQPGFLLIGQDVTERKILESQLSQAQKLESIGQLAAGIAHEINTPTQYVGDNIRFLQDSFTDLSDLLAAYQQLLDEAKAGPVAEEKIAEIEDAQAEIDVEFLLEEIPSAIGQSLEGIERVSGIVRAMKEFSHPGVDQKTAIDINKAIDSTITVARNEWKYVADLETDFDATLPPVPCLPGEFNQAILNMIINATHAIADVSGNGSRDKGVITVKTRRHGEWVEIRISDTGTGIPPAVRPRIFDPFFTTKEVGQGTGQGLSIAHSVIVDKHGGMINFETELGQGTTFTIQLPLNPEAVMEH
jgi:PAS domain S-box-containing protein